jgi:hypothetical protein
MSAYFVHPSTIGAPGHLICHQANNASERAQKSEKDTCRRKVTVHRLSVISAMPKENHTLKIWH